MSEDWDDFCETAFWRPQREAKINVEPTRSPAPMSEPAQRLFPALSALLSEARVTPVSIGSQRHLLYGWSTSNFGRLGWLCPYPDDQSNSSTLFEPHRILHESFGGIVERWNEPSTWLLNMNEVLTMRMAATPIDLRAYDWAFEKCGGIPINMQDWYAIAWEANGNLTICHRSSGEILMFAPDHSFDFVVPLEGCPKYTLYRISSAPNFIRWIETVATQWLSVIAHHT